MVYPSKRGPVLLEREDFGLQRLAQGFVGVEGQDPVVRRLLGRPVFLSSVSAPAGFDHPRAQVLRQFHGAVGGAAVEDQDFVAAAEALDRPRDVALLVDRDDGGGDFHGSTAATNGGADHRILWSVASRQARRNPTDDKNRSSVPPQRCPLRRIEDVVMQNRRDRVSEGMRSESAGDYGRTDEAQREQGHRNQAQFPPAGCQGGPVVYHGMAAAQP